jgi:hypothetical protein
MVFLVHDSVANKSVSYSFENINANQLINLSSITDSLEQIAVNNGQYPIAADASGISSRHKVSDMSYANITLEQMKSDMPNFNTTATSYLGIMINNPDKLSEDISNSKNDTVKVDDLPSDFSYLAGLSHTPYSEKLYEDNLIVKGNLSYMIGNPNDEAVHAGFAWDLSVASYDTALRLVKADPMVASGHRNAFIIPNVKVIQKPGFAGRQYAARFIMSPWMLGIDGNENMEGTFFNISGGTWEDQTSTKYVQYTFSDDGKSYQLSFGNSPEELFTETAAAGANVYGKRDIPLYESRETPGIYLTDPLNEDYHQAIPVEENNSYFNDALTGYQQCGIQFSKAPDSDDPFSKMIWVGPSPLLRMSVPSAKSFRSYYPKWAFDNVVESLERFDSVYVRDPLNFIVKTDASGFVLNSADEKVASGLNIHGTSMSPESSIPHEENRPKRLNIWMKHIQEARSTNVEDFPQMGGVDDVSLPDPE